jgi:DNA (cytosine-5)-methyltransferase 1
MLLLEPPRSFGAPELNRIVHALSATYGEPDLGNQKDPLDELAYILLASKTDAAKYESVYQALKKKFPAWEELLAAPLEAVEDIVRPAGMGTRRARLLKECLQRVVEEFGILDLSPLATMPVEEAVRRLASLPGVGQKSARCILLYCFDRAVLPVDIHTYRLGVRLGLISRRVSYDRAHARLEAVVPGALRRSFHVAAVAHGRARCRPVAPHCGDCPVRGSCGHPAAMRPLSVKVRPRPLAIDVFAGAGGLSLGLEMAGFEVVQAVEREPNAAATYGLNHPDADVLDEPIEGLDPERCMQRLGMRPGDLTLLAGGLPCQGFSESNRRTRTLENTQNHLYTHLLGFVRAFKPAWVLIENVAGLRTMAHGAILERILGALSAEGYAATWQELNAADFGVPQLRRRLFIIGNRIDAPAPISTPSHGDSVGIPHVCVRDAIEDLPELENGDRRDELSYRTVAHLTSYELLMRHGNAGSNVTGNLVTCNSAYVVERYPFIPQGGNWQQIPEKLLSNYKDYERCHTGIYHRLLWEAPSRVIGNFRKNMLIHPSQDRGLSVREAARLQSFPDRYLFTGSIGFQQQQVADAVPPILAAAVAKSILNANRGQKKLSRTVHLELPPWDLETEPSELELQLCALPVCFSASATAPAKSPAARSARIEISASVRVSAFRRYS